MCHRPASLRHLLGRASAFPRRAVAALLSGRRRRALAGPSAAAPSPADYELWLRDRIDFRRPTLVQPDPGEFSIITCLYERSPANLFRETADSVFAQTAGHFQWVVLAQGTLPPDLETVVRTVAADPRVHVVRRSTNLGIIPGLRLCFEACTGRYVLTLDGDDLLTPDALGIMARTIADRGRPPFVYSDEDMYVAGRPAAPYFRPDWDPVLNLSSSYVFHLCAYDRALGQQLGVYTDSGSNWCHDWDTITRFARAGHAPVHVAEVLHHWRAHAASSTNQANPESGSLASQKNVLQRYLETRADGHLFEIKPFPLWRGAHEWWLSRKHERPEDLDVVFVAPNASINGAARVSDLRKRIDYPIGRAAAATDVASLRAAADASPAPYVLVLREGVSPTGDEWPWEAVGLFALHADLALLAGRVINPDRIVLGGPERFTDHAGDPACPYRGLPAHHPGEYALALKPQTVELPNSAFFLARTDFLRDALAQLPPTATLAYLGPWLALVARRQNLRTGFSPLIQADARPYLDVQMTTTPEERAAYHAHRATAQKST
jgi:glycosyltransferase involved in cell wall biosynthesis